MYKIKNSICILTLLAMTLSVSACTKNKNTDNNSSESQSETSVDNADEDYEKIMELASKLRKTYSEDKVIEVLGRPDEFLGSGIQHFLYFSGKYAMDITFYDNPEDNLSVCLRDKSNYEIIKEIPLEEQSEGA